MSASSGSTAVVSEEAREGCLEDVEVRRVVLMLLLDCERGRWWPSSGMKKLDRLLLSGGRWYVLGSGMKEMLGSCTAAMATLMAAAGIAMVWWIWMLRLRFDESF